MKEKQRLTLKKAIADAVPSAPVAGLAPLQSKRNLSEKI
jgi:hypothetical protein